MNLEELKAMLAEGTITQEEFDAKVAQAEETPEEPKGMTAEEIQRLVAEAVGKATNRLGNENKQLREENEKLDEQLQGSLSEEERAKHEVERERSKLAQREAELSERENRWYALEALKKAGLDDGGDRALKLVSLVLGEDSTVIDENVKALGGMVAELVAAKVDKIFKDGGTTPRKGGGGGNEPNPWSKATFNLTKQMEIENADPEKAERLKGLAQN